MSTRTALFALLPGPEETSLLEACLGDGDVAREGWMRWRARRDASGTDLRTELSGRRTLLPLLATSVSRNGISLEPDVQAYLHAAYLREERRALRFFEIASAVLEAFEHGGPPPVVLRGAALAVTVYSEPAHRHCHDLDLIVASAALEDACDALKKYVGGLRIGSRAGSAIVEHPSGMRIALHTRPFSVAHYDAGAEGFTRGIRIVPLGSTRARVPSPEATLVHVLGHATCSGSSRNLHWVADAWHLVTRHRDLDWNDVCDRIESHRLSLPVSILLEYLASFGVPVPGAVLSRIREGAGRADGLTQEIALGGLFASVRGDVGRVWRTLPSAGDRLRVVRWAALPSVQYVRSTFAPQASWVLPLLYLYRPARFLAGKLRRNGGGGAERRAPDP